MKALVIYATHKGNTRRVAEAIANGLRMEGSAAVRSVDESPAIADEDLIVIGGPTEGHHVIPEVYEFLDRLPAGALTGRRVEHSTRASIGLVGCRDRPPTTSGVASRAWTPGTSSGRRVSS